MLSGMCRRAVILPEGEAPVMAILLPNGQAICGCCGAIFEGECFEILKEFKDWENIVDATGGEEFQEIYWAWYEDNQPPLE